MPGRFKMRAKLLPCYYCAKDFITRHSRGKYCSTACARLGERKSWRKYGAGNKARRVEKSKTHYERNKVERLSQIKAYRKTVNGKIAQRVHDVRARKKYPEKIAAREAVRVAVRKGTLIRLPCENCSEPNVHGHHDDYSKPLEVRWLCEPCHRAVHRKETP